MITKFSSSIAHISYLPKTLRLVWTASGSWLIAWAILIVLQGILPAVGVYLTRFVVDGLVAVMGTGVSWQSIQPALVPFGLFIGVVFLGIALQNLLEFVRAAQSELVSDHITALVHQKSTEVDFAFYESSEYYDRLNRARSNASGESLSLLESFGSLIQNTITLLMVAAILLSYGVWLAVALIFSALPSFYIIMRLNRYSHRWWERRTTERRRLEYYDMLLTSSTTAAELRLFNLGSHFQSAYQTGRQRLRKEYLRLVIIQNFGRLGATLLALLMFSAPLVWIGWQILLGKMTIGQLALFFQALQQSRGVISSLLGNLGRVYRSSLFINNLFEFLQLQPKIINPPQPLAIPQPLQQAISFRQVSFRYPGSDEPVLQDFNLTIPAGKIVAIVGDNGAGKSTLIKLLCRFYDPESGGIELDGIDIRNFAVAEYQRLITVLFQFPVSYYITAADNIALGDLASHPSQAEIEAAARGAGIHDKILSLTQGYNSILGKLFPGGTEFSGGQWQRLALARAFLRQAQIIILDEPTSAMDPWAEFDWLERFRTMANGRTAVVITHRFTLAMRADIIHVMRAGEIVESGRHDELLAQGGLYAESWQAQMQADSSVPV